MKKAVNFFSKKFLEIFTSNCSLDKFEVNVFNDIRKEFIIKFVVDGIVMLKDL